MSTYFCSDFKETPAIEDKTPQIGYNLRSGRNEPIRRETAEELGFTSNIEKNEYHFGDLLELNQKECAMN